MTNEKTCPECACVLFAEHDYACTRKGCELYGMRAADTIATVSPNNEIRSKLLTILPYLRCAVEDAAKEVGKDGHAQIGVLATKWDGTGKVLCRFSGEFIEDLAKFLDAPPLTDEDRADAKAERFLSENGLR